MTDPTGLNYEALYAKAEAQAATITGMHHGLEALNAQIRQLQEMAQHTNNAVEDAFGVKPSNEPDENHLALIEDAGYRLMRAEAAIERVRALCDSWANVVAAARVLDALEAKR